MNNFESDKKRVCIVAPCPPPFGGMSVLARNLSIRLTKEGVSTELIATNPRLPGFLRFADHIPGLRTLIREVLFLATLIKAAFRCEVIHHFSASHFYFFAISIPVLLVGKAARCRVVLNYHGGHAADFFKKWSLVVIPAMKLADVIVVPSGYLQRTFAEFGLRAQILPNVADVECFAFRHRDPLRPRLLVTRQLEPIYNVSCVIRAFEKVREQFSDAELGIAGAGSEERKLRELVKARSIQGVVFYGSVDHTSLPQLYDKYDFLVNASNIDNFPGVLIEGACAGLAIVSTAAGGIPDMVSDRETAMLVTLNDDNALASRIIDMIAQPIESRRIIESAHQWVQQYRWENVSQILYEFYGSEGLAPISKLRSIQKNAKSHVGAMKS